MVYLLYVNIFINMVFSKFSLVEIVLYFLTCLFVAISLVVRMPILAVAFVMPLYLLYIFGTHLCKDSIPRICVNLLVFQNLIIGILSHLLGYATDDLTYLNQLPFIFLCLAFFGVIVWEWRAEVGLCLKLEDWSFLGVLALLLFQFLTSTGGVSAKIVGIRNYTTFYLSYRIGKHCLNDKEKLIRFFRYLIGISVFVVLVGLVMYGMGFRLWEAIGIREVYIAKRDLIVGERLPDRFFTNFLGYSVKRMGSVYYEPVNLAYLLGCALLIALFSPWTSTIAGRIPAILILAGGLALTFGKGGMMVTGMGVGGFLFYSVFRMIKKGEERRAKNLLLIILIPLIFFAGRYYVGHYNESTNPHFVGILSTWESVKEKPLGYGLGTGGNANLMFDGVEGDSFYDVYYAWLASGGETALMAFLYQMGVPALIFFFLCFHGMTTRVCRENDMGAFRFMVALWPYFLLGISIYQENTYTPQCIIPFMLIIGGMAGGNLPLKGISRHV